MCSIPFENKGVEFINTDHVLRIDKPLPSSSVKFPMPMVTYKWTTAMRHRITRKRSTKKIKAYRKSDLKEPKVKRCLLILDLKPVRS